MSQLTTHVLDTTLGRPAAGVPVTLAVSDAGEWTELASGTTDDDGRARSLGPDAVPPGRYRFVFDTAVYFQENLRQVGVTMKLSKMEFKTFLDRIREHRFQAYMSGLSLDVDPDPFDLFHSSQSRSGINHVSYSNPEVDRLCEQGRRVGIPTPFNDAIVAAIRSHGVGKLRPDPKNLEPLAKLLPR